MVRYGLILFALFLGVAPSLACSVPVFRFALERWAPSAYEIVVFHRGSLTPTDRDVVSSIQFRSRFSNVRVIDVDLDDSPDPVMKKIWMRERKDLTRPHVVVRYPDSGPESPSLWSGPLSADAIGAWIDSPGRRRVFDALTAGNSSVIILLQSGNVEADHAARTMLARELPRIAARIELPEKSEDGPHMISELPLRIDFKVVEVARSDEERALVCMLLKSEVGLEQVRGPIAFPVFGRGRALCSLHGKDLDRPAELHRSLEFLCRACSCQVKELNPGLDLLITGNWDLIFEVQRGPEPREIPNGDRTAETGSGGTMLPPAESQLSPHVGYDSVVVDHGESAPSSRPQWLRYGLYSAIALVGFTGVWVILSRRSMVGRP